MPTVNTEQFFPTSRRSTYVFTWMAQHPNKIKPVASGLEYYSLTQESRQKVGLANATISQAELTAVHAALRWYRI